MKLLIVSATEAEIQPFLDWRAGNDRLNEHIAVVITGVGMTATAYSLTRELLTNSYDAALQVGVGGCFDERFGPGDLVLVTSEQFGDLGAEDRESYLDIFELGLHEKDEFPFTGGKLLTSKSAILDAITLPHASSLTINTVSGSEQTIKLRKEKYDCTVESMEGAAFHYVCLKEGVPFVQVRAISNMVIPRDKSQWKMKDAIINLNKWLIGFVEASLR